MPQPNDLSRSLAALDQNSTIIAVVELSHSSWLVGGVVPGIERQPRKKLEPSPERLLALLHRWRDEAAGPGRKSRVLRWPSKPAATACGWRAGLRRVASRLT
jgi:transposase